MSQNTVLDATRQLPPLPGAPLAVARGPLAVPTSPGVEPAGAVVPVPPVDPVEAMVLQLRDPARLAALHRGRTPLRSFDAQYWACWAVTGSGLLTAVYLLLVR